MKAKPRPPVTAELAAVITLRIEARAVDMAKKPTARRKTEPKRPSFRESVIEKG